TAGAPVSTVATSSGAQGADIATGAARSAGVAAAGMGVSTIAARSTVTTDRVTARAAATAIRVTHVCRLIADIGDADIGHRAVKLAYRDRLAGVEGVADRRGCRASIVGSGRPEPHRAGIATVVPVVTAVRPGDCLRIAV